VREISSDAGVNCALISRYFGSKLGLFRDVLTDETDYRALYSGPLEELGARLARFVVSGVIETDTGKALTVDPSRMLLFVRSVGCPEALPALRDALAEKMTLPLAAVLPGPNATEKAAVITSHIFGFILIHRMVGAACVVQADTDILTQQLASSLQTVIDHR